MTGDRIKISELPLGTAPSGSEPGPFVQSGNTVSLTANQIATLAATQIAQTTNVLPVWNAKNKYNLDNTGQVDNAAALAVMQSDLAAISATLNYPNGSPGYPAGARPMPKIIFEPGVYAFSAWPNFAFNNLWMEASGQVELWFRGQFPTGVTGNVFGDAFTFDAPAIYGTSPYTGAFNVRFQGFRLVPVGTCSDALVMKMIHHSHFNDLHIQGAGVDFLSTGVHYNCVNIQHCVCTEFADLHISAFDNITSVTTPTSGGTLSTNRGVSVIQLNPPGFLSSACTFINPVIEGLFDGVWFDQNAGGAFNFRGGTIEGCANTGVTIRTGNRMNYFDCIDMESNAVFDVLCEAGSQETAFIHCGTGGVLTVSDSGTNNTFNPDGTQTNQPLNTSLTPSFTGATLDASTQTGITILNGGNAIFCPAGQGMLALVCNGTSTSTQLAIAGGGGIQAINAAANWTVNTTTPGAGDQSLAFDGSAAYRIYNNTGNTVTYKVIVLKPL